MTTATDRRTRFLARLGWLTFAAGVALGVPLFVRMPPWCDLTLYQVASANVQAGGVLYRDVFDTNLPGFIAALTVVRTLFGPSVEAVRLADLAVVAGILGVLARWTRAAGAGPAGVAWFCAGAAWFYLFTSEFNHCQRDVWMLLPAAAAAAVRTRRLLYAGRRVALPAAAEGVLWGLAVWIKPHVFVPAAAVWLATVPRLAAVHGWRGVLGDALGMLLGGGVVGAAGVGLLVWSGTWPHFLDVFTFWNAGYADMMWKELADRGRTQFHYFPPWNYLHVAAIPVAARSVLDARPVTGGTFRPGAACGPAGALTPAWLWDAGPGDPARFARGVLGTFYLAWTAQALLFQRGFHYVHVPEVLLLLAVLATQRWLPGLLVLAWLGVTTALVRGGAAPDDAPPAPPDRAGDHWPHAGHVSPEQRFVVAAVHPLAQFDRWKLWPACFRFGLTDCEYYQRWADLALVRDFFPANDWPELAEVAAELRRLGAADGDVIAWHDAPHAVYTLIPARPGFRFQHVTAMMAIGLAQEDRIWDELEALPPGPRWAVTDLHRVGFVDQKLLPSYHGAGSDLLPPLLSGRARRMFPLDQPAIFRSGGGAGRYVIHAVERPLRRPY